MIMLCTENGGMEVFKSDYFELGMQVVTAGIHSAMKMPMFAYEVGLCMKRYCNKDWGVMDEEDKETNNQALIDGNRIMAAYETCKGKIWIITEADRSVTTVLFPDEY